MNLKEFKKNDKKWKNEELILMNLKNLRKNDKVEEKKEKSTKNRQKIN